jgi:hypothetical protein
MAISPQHFEAMAETAGFTSAISLPCGPDPTGAAAIAASEPQMDALDGCLGDLRAALDMAARGGACISATAIEIHTRP